MYTMWEWRAGGEKVSEWDGFMGESATYLLDVTEHTNEEGLDIINTAGIDDLSVVKCEAYPEIVHEHWEQSHHRRYPDRTAEFIAERSSDASNEDEKDMIICYTYVE